MTEITIRTEYGGSYSPSNEEFWSEVVLELEGAQFLLTQVHVETQEEALLGTFRCAKGDNDSGMEVIRRRNVGASFDQLDHYINLGRALLPRVWQLVEGRDFTREFVRIWMDLQLCHGFLIAHYMDNSDDLTAHRGGAVVPKQIAAQRKWLCFYLAGKLALGKTLADASADAYEEVQRRINLKPAGEFDAAWYARMIAKDESGFTSSLRTTHRLFTAEILQTALGPKEGIPPL